MKVAPEIQIFIESHVQLIKEEDFESLYEKVEPVWMRKDLTETLLEAGINPLEYMNKVPSNFLAESKQVTTFDIPNNIKSIGLAAFIDCTQLTNVNIPDSVTTIGVSAFSGCSGIESMVIPDLVTTVDAYTFYNCTSLANLSLPKAITSIRSQALLRTNLVDLVYRGTKDQWEKIKKSHFWASEKLKCIHCLDGDIFL